MRGRSTAEQYDLVVVGGGVFGLSVAREAGLRGRRTLVVERRTIPNPIAASYGPSRKIRSTYVDPHYAHLARLAMASWRDLERESGEELYVACGNLAYTTLVEQPRLDALEDISRQVGATVSALNERELRARFPQFHRARRALFESDAGFLRATACVEALYRLASRAGVQYATGQDVEAIEPSSGRLTVRAGSSSYRADRVVVAGGGWSARLLPGLKPSLWQCQQGIAYLASVPEAFRRPAFVPFSCADNGFYGFPAENGVGLKIAEHALGEPTPDPDFDRSTTPPGFREGVERFAREDLGLDPSRHALSFDSCMYNLSPSNDFLLDAHPLLPNVFVATAGSGHGFKFGSILGRIVLDRLDGVSSDLWSEQFSYASFAAREQAASLL